MQLAGELNKVNLPSLIQLLRNGELTGKVCLTQGANTAFIYVLGGRLVHVETDTDRGRAALLELFLWNSGTFSLVESDGASMEHTLPADEPVEKIIREGLAYHEQKKYLDQLRISSRTILQPVAKPAGENLIYARLDGHTALGDIVAGLNMPKVDYIHCVYQLLAGGHAAVVDPPADDQAVKLPAWVVSRLQQDNPDISQSIVQMVIWVDRVKCWMYQADADLEKVIGQLEPASADSSTKPETASQ